MHVSYAVNEASDLGCRHGDMGFYISEGRKSGQVTEGSPPPSPGGCRHRSELALEGGTGREGAIMAKRGGEVGARKGARKLQKRLEK